MRRSGWVLPGVALLLWLAAVGYPVAATIASLSATPTTDRPPHSAGELLLITTAWALSVALAATVLGWIPGRVLGRALQGRGFIPLAIAMLAPICVPAYVVFWCWWQVWPEGSDLFDWAVQNEQRAQFLKGATLLTGLVCWSWPLVAWCVAGAAAATPAQREELLRLDSAGPVRRLVERLRADGRGLALGGLIVFLVIFNHTTSFDLAGIFTFANELRAADALGANVPALLRVAAPALGIAALGTVIIWLVLGGSPPAGARRASRLSRSALGATIVIWLVSVLGPVLVFVTNLGEADEIGEFFGLYGGAVAGTLGVAAVSGGLSALIAVGLAAAWQDHRPLVRTLAHLQALGWIFVALVPGTIVGVAMEAAYNIPLTITPGRTVADLVYLTPAILVAGYLARFGFVAALLGRWMAVREPRELAALRRLDGAQTLGGMFASSWPRFLAVGLGTMAVVTTLSLSEIPVTARLQPPGAGSLAAAVLNALHYQRPDTVMFASLVLIAAAIAAAVIAVLAWAFVRRAWRGTTVAALAAACLLGVTGCDASDRESHQPLQTRFTFGSPGISLGQFDYPRALAVDAPNQFVYIVDKTARVQRFGFDGRPQLQWQMPQRENGKPTGISVAPDGRVFVADTHYQRIIAYDSQGHELMRFGRYGEGPGEFIYPTDVAFGPDGRLYVSEYGGSNDRIQVFTAQGEYLFGFGSYGSEVGQYSRPQSMLFSSDRSELYIADACNHRIVVVDPEGNPLRVLGGSGRGPGQFAYPYGLMGLDDGSLLVCEYGNNRVQRLSPAGECLGLFGRPGTGDGELHAPWAVDGDANRVFVLDSRNNRVQVIRTPS